MTRKQDDKRTTDSRRIRLGINTEVSRYILGIGNTKQLTTNTIYRIGSLLYILARINILGGAPVVSMFGVNLIKCQHLKSCLTPIYCGRLNWWACLAPVLQNVNFSSHVWRQSYKMSTSDVNFYSNFGANLTKCQLLNISIRIGQYQYWGLLRYWQYQYIHSSSIVLPNMEWGRINSGP